MNKFLGLMNLLILHSFISSIHSKATKQPLIFNPRTLEIHNLEDKSNITTGSYAIACPGVGKKEISLNTNISLDNKALFVQNITNDTNHDLNEIKCEESYKLSIVFHSSDDEKFLEFGYEIYYKEFQFKEDYKQSQFKEFRKASEINSRSGYFLRSLMGKSNTIKDQDVKWIFAWIPKVKVQYDVEKRSVSRVSYPVDYRKYQTERVCDDNNLSNRWFDINWDELYSQDNQEDIFSNVPMPPSVSNNCRLKYQCLKRYNLVTADYFQTSEDLETVSCSNLTIIPIWDEEFDALLNYSEIFLTVAAQVVGKGLEVTVGVNDIMSTSDISVNASKKIPLYLDHKMKKIPIPKVIYKIVTYKPDNCKVTDGDSCKYDMVIVIHNHPKLVTRDKLCDDKCAEWGWDSIKYLNTDKRNGGTTDFMYCCELNDNMRRILHYDDKTPSNGVLNLKRFPVYSVSGGKPRFAYKMSDVEDRMNLHYRNRMYVIPK